MKQRLYIMIGCPGSGKTTFAKNKLITPQSPHTLHISRDTIRFSILKDGEDYFLREKEVYREFIFQIYDGLRKGYDIIADATHLNKKSRTKLFKNIPNDLSNIEVVGIFMRTPLEICIERNEKRKGQKTYVPVENLRKMFFAIQPPTIEENDHIFDIILTINENGFVTKRETQLERK